MIQGDILFSSYFSFLQTSKTSVRSVSLNSPPELGSKKTLHLFIIFFIFANIQNFQKIRLCYIVPQNWGLVEHFRFWPWSSFCKFEYLLNIWIFVDVHIIWKWGHRYWVIWNFPSDWHANHNCEYIQTFTFNENVAKSDVLIKK